MAEKNQKKELRPFLDAINASNSVKGQLAQAYYRDGIAALVGVIERLTIPGPNRMRILAQMVTVLPAPDWITIRWLMGHSYFTGSVSLTSQAFYTFWVETQFPDARNPSWMYTKGEDPRRFVGAWSWLKYGRFVDCSEHGRQFVTERVEHSTGTVYDDGSRDERFRERLACGCEFDCWVYADGDIRRYRVAEVTK